MLLQNPQFKAKSMNAFGEDPQTKNVHLPQEHKRHACQGPCNGRLFTQPPDDERPGPIFMDTPTVVKKLAETMSPKEIKHLDAEARKGPL